MFGKLINLDILKEKILEGETFEYISFLNGPFSQWYHSPFEVKGISYDSSEQYMMAQKALSFKDKKTYSEIMKADNPALQKHLGQQIENFNEKLWNEKKSNIVFRGNWHKFTQNRDLKIELLKTRNTVIVEASPIDVIWGCRIRVNR